MPVSKDVQYHDRLLPLQYEYSRAYQSKNQTYSEAIVALANRLRGGSLPETIFDIEEPPDMPMRYMGSSPIVLNFLQSLVLLRQPPRILEIGTFIGLSVLAMAAVAPPAACLRTIEKYQSFANLARKNIDRNSDKCAAEVAIEVIVGDAVEVIDGMGDSTFEFIFIDGDKENYPIYLENLATRVASKGIIIIDDVFFHGDALNELPQTDKGRGVRKGLEYAVSLMGFHKTLLPISNGILLLNKLD